MVLDCFRLKITHISSQFHLAVYLLMSVKFALISEQPK